MTFPIEDALAVTPFMDYTHHVIQEFVRIHSKDAKTDRERAVALYYAIRDGIRYNPYQMDFTVEGMRASTALITQTGWCVTKAVLLAACCRAMKIPAILGFADVKNHLTTERLKKAMGTDVFEWHGYTAILIDGKWVKATPAFNIELCQRSKINPLEFDGTCDSLFHPFDLNGNVHMEYLRYRGEFTELPLEQIKKDLEPRHSQVMDRKKADFQEDVERERSGSGGALG
ncbi:transglutaminase family protein [Desulfosarcina sp. OttesenSCG-928-A07]|nr:transglutaminase family protein [Desulfosarcina sp. OttesenSCG-928-G17]MDL2329805.1 transglutaminase family protein [Desulfosarcina sp. OttesenSCG-928-A07]